MYCYNEVVVYSHSPINTMYNYEVVVYSNSGINTMYSYEAMVYSHSPKKKQCIVIMRLWCIVTVEEIQ